MFDFLKKKISGFVNKITGKEKQKEKQKEEAVVKEEKPPEQKPVQIEKIPEAQIPEVPETEEIEKLEEKPEKEKKEPEIKEQKSPVKQVMEKPLIKEKPKITEEPEAEPEKKPEHREKPKQQQPKPERQVPKEKEREVKVGMLGHLKSVFTGEIEIGSHDVKEMLETLELELIESDVALEVSESIKKELEQKLVGRKIKKGELNDFIKNAIRDTLLDIISSGNGSGILEFVNASQKPVKIMFLGTNGSGKTTTIAKVAKMLLDSGHGVVLAAADTFRAAAIEQLSMHAERLGVKIIKREYGSDPTAVAYDAVNYAKAHSLSAVLIDTAGRQETNFNLLNELKKMQRVIQPDMKIFVGESIAGNAIISQVSEFKSEIGVDGVILTKLDCDPKGGTVLSISKVTGVPILYLGTGQKYGDLEKFDARSVVARILS